ncbi:MAG: acyl-CoA desaturase [Chitinophagaceae bacterium]|nr:MAG: acyl-CoA desaturase [Chitinophagaceae bacterium]
MSKLVFNNSNNAFANSLKQAVDKYFVDNKIEKTGDWRLYLKTVIFLLVGLAAYWSLMLVEMNVWAAVGLAMFIGVVCAGIGFSVMHDANHGAYSADPKMNDIIGLTLNALGANSYFWKQKHNILHHTYTNIDGIDDDIAKSPIIRQCESQVWVPAHRVQHFYLPFVYSLSSLFWILFMDFAKYFGRKINGVDAWKLKPVNHVVFWLTKLNYALFFVAIPIYFWGVGGWLAGFFIMNMTLGLILALVFQLAHVVEKTEFEHVPLDTTKHLESAWAEHQVKTTCNFAMGNPFINWYVGGLNFQIEHHLFPRISHVHYPAISKIVAAQCRQFGLPYNYYPTMSGALGSHFRFMKYLGQKPAESAITAQAA